MNRRVVFVLGLAAATAAFGSIMDEAKFWWKFDQGGANGAVAQTSEIHDCRDASVGVASRMCGPSGGPLWTNMTVRLPYSGREVQASALNVQVITNAAGTQIRPSMVDISGGYVNSDTVTFFARICPGEQLYTNAASASERFIFNNNFYWGSTRANSFGQLFGISRNGSVNWCPRYFIGQEQDTFGSISLEPGKWYDLAFSISMVTNVTTTTVANDTTNVNQRVMCVVAGEKGTFYQTSEKPYRRAVAFSGSTALIGGQQFVNSWQNLDTGVSCKDYNGLIHEMALWDRALNLGEIFDVFGRPEAPSGGDVFSDVYRWWKFDRDLDGNGKVSADELRDVRKWGTAAAPAAGNPEIEFVTDGGPLMWRNMSVLKPARGETVTTDCLVMEPEYLEEADTTYKVWCPHVRFKNSTVAGDLTIMTRLCFTKACDYYSSDATKFCYLFHDGFAYGSTDITTGGYQFGFRTDGTSTTNFYPIIYGGKKYNAATASNGATGSPDLKLTTNVWYDIAYTVSVQTNGKDRLTVTVADRVHGIRQWSGTLDTSQRMMVGSTLMLNGENFFPDWIDYRNADGTIANVNAVKNFTGALSQLAIWRRALSKDEIAAAFGYPRAVFGAGTADGGAGEFASSSEGSYDWTVGDTWHDMAGTLDASHRTLTLRFTPPPSWNGMDQGFHLVVGGVSGSDAQVSLAINGARFGSKAVATGDDLWWIVKGGAIHADENVATLTLSGTDSVAIDKFEMLGSWAVVSGVGGSFSHEGELDVKDFYVGDLDMTHIARAVTSGNSRNRLHFWLPAELAENYPFEFTFRTINHANSTAAFEFIANGEVVHSEPNGLINDEKTIKFAPGELKAGWNEIGPHYLSGGGAWVQFNRYILRMIGPEFGTILMVR